VRSTLPDARDPLGPRHPAVRRLRELLRDRAARAAARAFVVEGPRAVDAALDRRAPLECVYLGPNAEHAFASLVARVRDAGVPIERLKDGVLERVGSTVTPQPVLATASIPPAPRDVLDGDGLVLVLVGVADPGNLGTLIRSAEAAGVRGIVLGAGSVDAYNPKVVRASAGAIFGVPLLVGPHMPHMEGPVATGPDSEGWSVTDALDALRAAGRACYGTRATGGRRPDQVDLTARVAVLLGNEAHGLDPGLGDDERLDGWLSIPMTGPAESLNVAMAGTVVAFEAARQRADAEAGR